MGGVYNRLCLIPPPGRPVAGTLRFPRRTPRTPATPCCAPRGRRAAPRPHRTRRPMATTTMMVPTLRRREVCPTAQPTADGRCRIRAPPPASPLGPLRPLPPPRHPHHRCAFVPGYPISAALSHPNVRRCPLPSPLPGRDPAAAAAPTLFAILDGTPVGTLGVRLDSPEDCHRLIGWLAARPVRASPHHGPDPQRDQDRDFCKPVELLRYLFCTYEKRYFCTNVCDTCIF